MVIVGTITISVETITVIVAPMKKIVGTIIISVETIAAIVHPAKQIVASITVIVAPIKKIVETIIISGSTILAIFGTILHKKRAFLRKIINFYHPGNFFLVYRNLISGNKYYSP